MTSRRRWTVVYERRVRAQIDAIPIDERGRLSEEMGKLWTTPFPEGTSIPSLRRAPKVSRIAAGRWRALYVVFLHRRRVFVSQVVERDHTTYEVQRLEQVLREAREDLTTSEKRRNPLSVDERVRAILLAHPQWGDVLVARAAGCSPAAVCQRRLRWGVPARYTLPWLDRSERQS